MSFASGFIGYQIGRTLAGTDNSDYEAKLRLMQYEAKCDREWNEMLREYRHQQRLEQEKQKEFEQQLKLSILLKHKIGDKVQIKSELIPGKDTYRIYCAKSLLQHCGKEATITKVNEKEAFYELDIDNGRGAWCDQMFEDYNAEANTITINLDKYDIDTRIKIMKLVMGK